MSAVAKLRAQLERKTPILPMHYVLTAPDARELLQLIEDLCPEHGRCTQCRASICPVCDIDCRCEVVL